MWESRERRKAKEYEKEFEREEMRKEEMVRELKPETTLGRVTEVLICVVLILQEREKRDLAEFLEDYDDEKDDQRYYK